MRVGHVDVDAQHLAEQLLRILRAVIGIVARSAVAHADVEIAVGAEREVAAVVIRERLRDERRAAGAAPAQVESRARDRRRADRSSAGSARRRCRRIDLSIHFTYVFATYDKFAYAALTNQSKTNIISNDSAGNNDIENSKEISEYFDRALGVKTNMADQMIFS